MSQFSSTQQKKIAAGMEMKNLMSDTRFDADGVRFVLVLDGQLICKPEPRSQDQVRLSRGNWLEESGMFQMDEEKSQELAKVRVSVVDTKTRMRTEDGKSITVISAGHEGTRVAFLTREGMGKVLFDFGMSAVGNSEEAMDYMRKMLVTKKVGIFRHLSQQQTNDLVKCFNLQSYRNGASVITEGEIGSSFFVIASGEVEVVIRGTEVRTLSRNAYFGERALLFDEPRSATVRVSSQKAELWAIDKANFIPIIRGKMQEELEHRIRLQDTNVNIKDLLSIKVVGQGAAGVVRLVQHVKTGTRYALKRVQKEDGKVPNEVERECQLLAANDHPFVMTLVKTFETVDNVYMLTELITGGELHAAMRKIPNCLSRRQAQFYVGSLILVLESLQDRNIVYRDLKPENVMLDAQGYLKLIDFGIAKKMEEGKSRTFTLIGTPHYMAPEVMRGYGYGTEVDIWSLGVLHFEFVCGYLPFADTLEDPTEVCTSVLRDQLTFPERYTDQCGRAVIKGMLTRMVKKRLGTGVNGYDDLKGHDYFELPRKSEKDDDNLFQKIMGREIDPPVVPKGEQYADPDELDGLDLSDAHELATR